MKKANIIVGRNLLETITSALYENPIILFREYVQNSLDAYNFAISEKPELRFDNFCVKIEIDEAHKRILIEDNGYAIPTDEQFEADMFSFGDSKKDDRSKFIGFRGIGRLSGLPFCSKLTFVSKTLGSTYENICEWKGKDYKRILNTDYDGKFEDVVRKIVQISKSNGKNPDDHYFKVILEDYTLELSDVIESNNFEDTLTKMLPLRYKEEFTESATIINKYKEFMGEDLNDFMCPVKYNGKDLFKAYDNNTVLESGIIFKEIYDKSKSINNTPGKPKPDKIGIMWFTFNKKPTAINKDDSTYGILVRSKNVLMGNNDTLADLCSSSKEYITTHTELVSTLRCVYGEMLINSVDLKDNARREWFKTDEHSLFLKNIIVDYMKCLYEYRYAASKYYRKSNDENMDSKRKKLKEKLIALISSEQDINIDSFTKKEVEKEKKNEEEQEHLFSHEDVPSWNKTKKNIYDEIMLKIKDFFIKEKQYEVFLRLRAFIKNQMNGSK